MAKFQVVGNAHTALRFSYAETREQAETQVQTFKDLGLTDVEIREEGNFVPDYDEEVEL